MIWAILLMAATVFITVAIMQDHQSGKEKEQAWEDYQRRENEKIRNKQHL